MLTSRDLCLFLFVPLLQLRLLQWAEYVLFASLLLVVCIIFAIMARFYTYVNPAEIEAQFDEDEKKKGVGKENPYSSLEPVSQTNM